MTDDHCQNCADLERQMKELRAFTQRFDVRVLPRNLISKRYHGKPAHILSIDDDLVTCRVLGEEPGPNEIFPAFSFDELAPLAATYEFRVTVGEANDGKPYAAPLSARLGPCGVCGEVEEHILHHLSSVPSGRAVHKFEATDGRADLEASEDRIGFAGVLR